MSTLFANVCLAALLVLAPRAQDAEHPLAAGADWPTKVKAAIESPRYAIQRAASNDVARAGDAAVPAIRAYAEAKGKDAIPLLLVDAMAQSAAGGEHVVALLRQWGDDAAFFWRAQALTGLAQRKHPDDAPRFARALQDASHLMRVAGAKGCHALAIAVSEPWDSARAVLDDRDPRARVAFALHLYGQTRERAAMPVLVAALADDRSFLDDDWARRLALQSMQALARVAGTNFGYQGTQSLDGNRDAIDKFAKWAELDPPVRHERDAVQDLGGLELRSCRFGDLFVRWTDTELHFDLGRERKVKLSAATHAELLQAAVAATAGDEPRRVLGDVVCDYVQLTLRQPARIWKVAPGAVPAAMRDLLHKLVDALAAADASELAQEVRARLPQFAPRD